MNHDDLCSLLQNKINELQQGLNLPWRIVPGNPKNPAGLKPQSSWKKWTNPTEHPFKLRSKNWFCAEIKFPAERVGLDLSANDVHVNINGWAPFTLWIDGKQIFKEEYAWKATGPIAAPVELDSGVKHRLILCIEPDQLPTGSNPLSISVSFLPCIRMVWELSALSMQIRFAEVLAANAKEKELINRAAAEFDQKALKANDWHAVKDSIRKTEEMLMPFSARARQHIVHFVGHSHIDMDWMWTWRETVRCIRRDFKAVTDLMHDYPEIKFTHSQVPTYQVAQKMDPDIFAKIRKLINEGRWENASGTWVEGDLNMAEGESIARHMLYASDWSLKNLGTKAQTLWEPDTFGHPGNMPQLAKLGELHSYFQMRCNPGNADRWPSRAWEGVDGTTIPAFSIGYGGDLTPADIQSHLIPAVKKGWKNVLHIWGIGDHGGGLQRRDLRLFPSTRHKPVMPTFKFSTMPEFLAAIQKEPAKWPRNISETFTLFEGCFTTAAQLKEDNRRCEGALISAESLCVMSGIRRNQQLRDAWTPTLFNHFHDLLDGSAMRASYADTHKRAKAVLKKASAVSNEAMKILCRPAKSGSYLTLVNSTGITRTEPVCASLPKGTVALKDSDGRIVPVQQYGSQFIFIASGIPAFSQVSYTVLKKLPRGISFPCISDALQTHPEPWVSSKRFLRVETNTAVIFIDTVSGAIGSYCDKKTGREMVSYGIPRFMSHTNCTRLDLGLNVFQVIDESPNPMTAWAIHDVLREENLLRDAEVKMAETGPVFMRYRVKHKFRSSRIEEDIFIYQDFPRIDFKAVIDWREKGDDKVGVPMLKVSFGTAMSSARARFEGPYFITERPANGDEQPTQKFLDVTGKEFGFTLLNDSKYGCDVLGGRARITLLRNAYCPDPETDNGIHTVRFAFMPHGAGQSMTNAGLTHAGMAFNRPLLTALTDKPARQAVRGVQIGSGPVVITGLRNAEHSNGVILSMFETSGKPCRTSLLLDKRFRTGQEINFLENPIGKKFSLNRSGRTALRFRRFEVKTLLLKT